MFRNCLLVCLFGILISFISNAAANKALVGGRLAGINEFRYQVSIQNPDGSHICGGGIIDDQFIITVANCVVKPENRIDTRPKIVLAGTENLRRTESPAVIGHVVKIYVPKEFDPQDEITTGDIAILKLKESFDLWAHRNLRKLELPNNHDRNYVGKTAVIAAFRQHLTHDDSHKNKINEQLRYSEADIINIRQCQEGYETQKISEKHICARVTQHDDNVIRGTCIGDNGSPLVVKGKTIVGILSQSPADCNEKVKAGIYTRVSSFLDFIRRAMKDDDTDIRSASIIR